MECVFCCTKNEQKTAESNSLTFCCLYFQVIYRDNLYDKGKELQIGDCGTTCNLEDFKKVLEEVIPNDWEKECELV